MNESDIIELIVSHLEAKGIKFKFRKIQKICKKHNLDAKRLSLKSFKLEIYKHLSKKHKIFKGLFTDKIFFDFSFRVPINEISKSEIKTYIKESLNKHLKYIYINKNKPNYFIFLKFQSSFFDTKTLKNIPANKLHSFPYSRIHLALQKFYGLDKIVFNEMLIEKIDLNPGIIQNYNAILSSLRQIKLPLDIIEFKPFSGFIKDTLAYEEITECCIRLQTSKNWPEDVKAVQIAKSAFYCLIFKKTPNRYFLDVNYLVCIQNKSLFKFNILLENEVSLFNLLLEYSKLLQTKSVIFKDCIKFVKKLLGSHGFYPLILSDIYIESLFLIHIPDNTLAGLMLEKFFSLDLDLGGKVFDLSDQNLEFSSENKDFVVVDRNLKYHIDIPDRIHFKRLKILFEKFKTYASNTLNGLCVFNNYDLFTPVFIDFDVIFSLHKMQRFTEISRSINKKFILGEPVTYCDSKPLENIKNLGFYYFNPLKNLLMVKIKENTELSIVINLVLLETNFNFYSIVSNK